MYVMLDRAIKSHVLQRKLVFDINLLGESQSRLGAEQLELR